MEKMQIGKLIKMVEEEEKEIILIVFDKGEETDKVLILDNQYNTLGFILVVSFHLRLKTRFENKIKKIVYAYN